jgi:hypothetical protein
MLKAVVDELAEEGYDAIDVMLTDYNGPETPTAFPSIFIYDSSGEILFQAEGFVDKETLRSYMVK